jgi:hypothetical protein
MEVNFQLHVPAALPPVERTNGIHWIWGWMCLRAGLKVVEKRTSCPCRESNPSHPSLSPSLYRLSYPCNDVYSSESQTTFQKSISPSFSGSENNLSQKPELAACFMQVVYLADFSTVRTEAKYFSEKSISFQQTTWHYIQETELFNDALYRN